MSSEKKDRKYVSAGSDLGPEFFENIYRTCMRGSALPFGIYRIDPSYLEMLRKRRKFVMTDTLYVGPLMFGTLGGKKHGMFAPVITAFNDVLDESFNDRIAIDYTLLEKAGIIKNLRVSCMVPIPDNENGCSLLTKAKDSADAVMMESYYGSPVFRGIIMNMTRVFFENHLTGGKK